MQGARVTVVVPTRDRPESLARCLAALERQTVGDALEVLVVEDGGPGSAAPIVDASPRARLIRQPRAGPGAARNRAAQEAVGPVLCFTDDDCEPAPDWAERLERALADADGAIGTTLNADPDDPLAAAAQLVATHLTEASLVGPQLYGPASNFAARRELFLAIPFDGERFPFAGGDRDWCDRFQRAGHRLVYVCDAVVMHRQELSLRSFWRQQHAYGRGSYRFRTRSGASVRLERPSFYTGLLARGFREGARVGSLTLVAQLATASGYAREALDRR